MLQAGVDRSAMICQNCRIFILFCQFSGGTDNVRNNFIVSMLNLNMSQTLFLIS